MIFGEKIREIRKKKGLSQRQLGEKMGVKQQTVAQYEKAIEQPKLLTVRKLAEALDVPLSDLINNWEKITADEWAKDLSDTAQKGLNSFHTIAAHFDGDEYTDEELEEIRKFAEFIKSKRKDVE